jgi:peptide/nickel transport system substrate-binding protein
VKNFRRLFWYISTYLSRYKKLILTTISTSLLFSVFVFFLWPKLPHPKPTTYISVVGNYSSANLPPLVNEIVDANFFNVDANQNITPHLAKTIETLEDGKTYTITLEDDLFWPDGNPVKSEDVQIQIPKVETSFPSENQIKFSLPEPFAPFPSVLETPIINELGQTPTGFTVSITQTTSGQLRNVQIEDETRKIIIKTFSSPSQSLTSFKLGEVDAVYGLRSEPEDLKTLNIKAEEFIDYQNIVTLFFNTKDPLLSDKNIRQAIAYLIEDKNQQNENALTSINKQSWVHNPLIKNYEYDSSKGKQLLNDNLSKENLPLNLEISTLPEFISLADSFKEQLLKYDINLTVRVVNNPDSNFQLFLGQFVIPPDPDQYIYWHSTQKTNITGLNSQKIDLLLEEGRTIIDLKERKKIYLEFQKSLAEELPALFLYYPKSYNLVRGSLSF